MGKAKITVHSKMTKGDIDKRLFGSFIEHMGTVIYTGIYEPTHPNADENGFRKDVLKLVKELELGVVRYPGGNFTSAYNWEDTIGPKDKRPKTLELAWKSIESNEFGLNEFIEWKDMVGTEAIIAINLGTRGVDAARNIVEYCNFEKGTYWSDLRREHGYEKPHNIKLWCLGNELDGPWQVASKTASEYGRLANEASKAMKWVDDSIETVLVGSSTPRLKSYPEWDAEVLMQAYENVDYIALHNYINRRVDPNTEPIHPENLKNPDDTETYLARAQIFDKQIETIIAACDYVKGVKRSNKTMYLAFDEWNIHREPEKEYEKWTDHSPIDWVHYTMEDTLLFASMGLSLLRHADRVKIGCQSLLVNTIPLILTEENGDAWVNPTYFVMKDLSLLAKGKVLHSSIESPCYYTEEYGDVSSLDSVVVDNGSEIVIFAVNRSEGTLPLESDLSDIVVDKEKDIQHSVLKSNTLNDKNTKDNPKNIAPINITEKNISDGNIQVEIPGYSWNVITIPYVKKDQ